jgi:hypothetical protein
MMSVSKSAVRESSRLVGYAGPIGKTATGVRALAIEYFPMVRRATALGLWFSLTRCAGLQTNTSKNVRTHGPMAVHALLGISHAR